MAAGAGTTTATPTAADGASEPVEVVAPPSNNTTVQQENPESVDQDGDESDLRSWLSGRLAARLGESAVTISSGEYETARSVLGDDYSSLLSKYVDVAGDTEGVDAGTGASEFQQAAETQTEYAETLSEYEAVYDDYRAAVRSGNTTRARELARRLQSLAADLNALGESLSGTYENLSAPDRPALDDTRRAISNRTANVTERTDEVVSDVFVSTTLRASAERNGSFGDPIRVTGKLATNVSRLSDGPVTIAVNGRPQTATLDANRSFALQYRPVEAPTGDAELAVEFRPNASSAYLGSNATIRTNVAQVAPSLTVANRTRRASYGEQVRWTGRVSVDGTPVPAADVHLTVNGTRLATAETNVSGNYVFDTSLPAEIPAGANRVSVRVGDPETALARTYENDTLRVRQTPTALSLDASATPDAVDVQGRLRVQDGAGVPDQTVRLRRDGSLVATLETNETGHFDATLPPLADAEDGSLRITAAYDERGTNFGPAEATATVAALDADASSSAWGGSEFLLGGALAALVVVGGAGYGAYRYRRTPETDEASGGAASASESDDGSDAALADDSVGDWTERADALLADGETAAAVRSLYAGVREELPVEARGRTHWEFYDDAAGEVGDEEKRVLRDLTEAYERVEFAGDAPDEGAVRDLLGSARRVRGDADADRNQYPRGPETGE